MIKEKINLKSPSEIEAMRASGRIVAEILAVVRENMLEGASTLDLERIAEDALGKRKAKAAFKGYKGYPYCLCTSLNDEIVHGMPSAKKILKSGDILSVDFGVYYGGFYGDSAFTAAVGQASAEARRLIEATERALSLAIDKARHGNHLSDISSAVQSHVEPQGFSVVREFVGHGIGKSLHEPPQIPNFGLPGKGARLSPGMVFAIEPMINQGSWGIKILDDGWTAVTLDGSLSAHFEHTVAVTPSGPEILTRP